MIDYKAKALELYPPKIKQLSKTHPFHGHDYNEVKRKRFINDCQWLLSELSNPKEDEEVLERCDVDGELYGSGQWAVALKAMQEVRARERANGEHENDRVAVHYQQIALQKSYNADRWIKVSPETMPERYKAKPHFSVQVLVTNGVLWDDDELTTAVASYNFEGEYWSYPGFEPIAWMPIPKYTAK